jgi:hypothetical protein
VKKLCAVAGVLAGRTVAFGRYAVQAVALPLVRIPVGALPAEQSVGVDARAAAVFAATAVLQLNPVPLV